jgi:formate dehydrogenase iron-sulfur subunit
MSGDVVRARLAFSVAPARANGEPSLLHALLAEQRQLTAVEELARRQDRDELPAEARRYRDLIPSGAPETGQQYAFDVDLDLCTGCKACVTGCHSLNGLDEGEVWRSVGLLQGGTPALPAQQTVTTSCHHCVEPACLIGCPVRAYEKDPITGIVKHLDDQCIGCQYCLFMCPYEAPKFDRKRGIVRKCDMCSDRLAHGEAPACVQACPNEAIRITVVEQADAVEAAQASVFVPGAAAPGDTLPTTIYRTQRALPHNLLPADFYALNPEHGHPPLVVMLVLTQLSVGAFTMAALGRALLAMPALGRAHALIAFGLGQAAMAASVFHLGRPRYAFRALLGLGSSWLSREILGFGIFSAAATGYAATSFVPRLAPLRDRLEPLVVLSGLVAVGCSVMVYGATKRAHWQASRTALRFYGSTLLLGTATLLLTTTLSGSPPRLLGLVLATVTTVKLTMELAGLRHLRDRQHTALKRTALLMTRELRPLTTLRVAAGLGGGVLLPLLLVGGGHDRAWSLGLSVALFALSLAGELTERYLFFAASTTPKMPGGPG